MKITIEELNAEEQSRKGDQMAYLQQEEHELSEYLETDEAQLSSFTTQQLNDEIARRLFEPLYKELKNINEVLDRLDSPF